MSQNPANPSTVSHGAVRCVALVSVIRALLSYRFATVDCGVQIQPADGWLDPKRTVIQSAALVMLTLMQRWTRIRSRSVLRIGHGRLLWRIFFGQIAG